MTGSNNIDGTAICAIITPIKWIQIFLQILIRHVQRRACKIYKIALTIEHFECSGEIKWIDAYSAFESYIFFHRPALVANITMSFLPKHCLSRKHVMISRIVFRFQIFRRALTLVSLHIAKFRPSHTTGLFY